MTRTRFDGLAGCGPRAALAGLLLLTVRCGGPVPQGSSKSSEQVVAAERAMANTERQLTCWKGSTPVFDGQVGPEEYSDADAFEWNDDWTEAMQLEIESSEDLDFNGWVKHDGEHLYLAFDVRDDVFYGIDTERWVPSRNPDAHVIGERQRGWPWFGDMIEILTYSRMLDLQVPVSDVTGDGRGVQIIYNLTKSHEGGVGTPGMLPHGPNRTLENWENNQRWIVDDIIDTRTVIHPAQNRYTMELRLRLDGGLEIADGQHWKDGMADTPIGFNLAIGDVDTPDKSPDGLLHHETWWAGKTVEVEDGTRVKPWGVLVLTSKQRDAADGG